MADPITPDSTEEQIKATLDEVDLADRAALREVTKDATPKQTFEIILPYGFSKRPEAQQKMAGVDATFQFNIEGEGGGQWALKVADQKLNVTEGTDEGANCTITMAIDDWKSMQRGELDPQAAFMAGKIKFAGDMSLAMKLGALLR